MEGLNQNPLKLLERGVTKALLVVKSRLHPIAIFSLAFSSAMASFSTNLRCRRLYSFWTCKKNEKA